MIKKDIISRLTPVRSFDRIASRSEADVITCSKTAANGMVSLV
jgi:hypothetical protein